MTYYMTKFEKIRILGARATQISEGAPSTIDTNGLTNAMEIAKKELKEHKLPLMIQRRYPNGKVIEIPVSDMKL